MESQIDQLKIHGQEHLIKFCHELTEDQKSRLLADIANVDWSKMSQIFQEQVNRGSGVSSIEASAKVDDKLIEELPPHCIGGRDSSSRSELDDYRQVGLRSIGDGKVAALLLAGGQGTRLGVDYPKGMFDVGPPVNKSLFQLQAERIMKLIEFVKSENRSRGRIIWYIMTSEATMAATRKFFVEKRYFGLDDNDVVFFQQNNLPCFSFDGKVLLSEKYQLAKAPDGNGGIYDALSDKGIIDHMTLNGIKYVHVYCVDNILVRVCDPVFLGYCISREMDIGVKVVEKKEPTESLGVLCRYDNKFKVIEYSEISSEVAQRRDSQTNKLVFRSGSICDHFFSVEFLKSIIGEKIPYHIAVKKIPHVSLDTGLFVKPDKPNGIKFEKFIFDVFGYTDRLVAWEVLREDEFSPLKNGIGSPKDNPETALKSLLSAHERGLLQL